ncbi:hypothetical protein Vadar_005200 [Vaccinium darrowii]|uniref:Uncharacterized protein n=1 Tax=Vaccinium darrowii TaxID=229202 RepID=A0ACB7Y5M1_9ERIC|nr:hypothetical protein Vadar_005200 [Vaccinium darrowii]
MPLLPCVDSTLPRCYLPPPPAGSTLGKKFLKESSSGQNTVNPPLMLSLYFFSASEPNRVSAKTLQPLEVKILLIWITNIQLYAVHSWRDESEGEEIGAHALVAAGLHVGLGKKKLQGFSTFAIKWTD